MLAEIWVAACFFVAHVYGKATPLGLCLFSGIAFLGLSLFEVVYVYKPSKILFVYPWTKCFFPGVQ